MDHPIKPIHWAAYHGDVAAIDQLVAEDPGRLYMPIKNFDDEMEGLYVDGAYPLMLAAGRGHDPAVTQLLALGACVFEKDGYGQMVAHWACLSRQEATLSLILDAGASVLEKDHSGSTPLHEAVIGDMSTV